MAVEEYTSGGWGARIFPKEVKRMAAAGVKSGKESDDFQRVCRKLLPKDEDRRTEM